MPRALVTGANGHIGCNLVRDLAEHGYEVVPFVREQADLRGLAGLDLPCARGDVLDPASVAQAMAGCELVFHAAAPYALWARDPAAIIEPAVRGTENVLRAAKKLGVRRVVLTSSSNAVGFTRDPTRPRDETCWNDRATSPYIKAKNEQEKLAWTLARELALDLVTVLPTVVLGRHDYRKTPTTAPFVDALAHRGPVPFPMNLVDVRDVARVHVLAAERGQAGERYLAGGENADMGTIAGLIEKHTGRRPAEGLPPLWLLRTVALVAEGLATLTGRAPPITRAVLDDAAGGVPLFDNRKAREQLGAAPRGAEEVVVETLRWAVFRGWVPGLPPSYRERVPEDPSWLS